jgi:hypothetical protein
VNASKKVYLMTSTMGLCKRKRSVRALCANLYKRNSFNHPWKWVGTDILPVAIKEIYSFYGQKMGLTLSFTALVIQESKHGTYLAWEF